MWTLFLGYLLIACLFFVEQRYESSRTTTSLQTSADDHGTTRLLLIVWLVCLTSPLLWALTGLGITSWWVGLVGISWILGGIVLLRWATMANPFYIRTMATTDDQFICTDGPYKVVRHPAYVAFLVAWVGFGLASQSWPALMTVGIVSLLGYIRRIWAEEQMMLERFGVDYQQYMNETFRIFPFLF